MQQFTNINDTVYFHFASNGTSGSGDDGATPVCDVRLCGAAADAAPVHSPTPVLLTDAGYPDGSHEVAIVASVANGFADGNTYAVFCSLAVDSETPTGFVGLFTVDVPEVDTVQVSGDTTAADNLELQYDTTGLSGETFPATQGQVGNISTGAGGLSNIADSFTLTTGSVGSGSITSTEELDEVAHVINDDGNVTDFYYEFDVGTVGIATTVTWNGYVQIVNNSANVYGWDWGSSGWKQIGLISGSQVISWLEDSFVLTAAMTGTGANIGLVRIRLESDDAAAIGTDRILCQYTNLNQTVGYANGQIWVDSAGTAGAELYVNGTADNPCPWANAKTINSTLGLNRFHIANGNLLTLDVTVDGYSFKGDEWDLDLGSQSCNDAMFTGADVIGIGTGAMIHFVDCELSNGGDLTISGCHAHACAIGGDIILTAATNYFFDQCYSAVAGTGTPCIDFGAAVGNQNVNFRHYSGGIEIKNMGQSGTDNMSLEGVGQFILNANCAGGTLAVRGSFSKTDNAGGAVTVVEDANFTTSILEYGNAQGSGTGNNQIQLATTASSSDGAYDPSMIIIIEGTGAGQSRYILEYEGSTRTATVDRNWKTNPDATSEYRVMADAGREHVNEGLAQSGSTSSTIKLNALASSDDDAYNEQVIFIRSGTGEDQARIITDYDGTSKVATVRKDWDVTPDTTSAYVMLPSGMQDLILDPMIVDSIYTVAALANAPAGTTLVTVAPINTQLATANFTTFGGTIRNVSIAQNASGEIVYAVTDAAGDPISLAGKTLSFNIHDYNDNIIFTLTTTAGDIVISGDDNNQVTVAITTTETANAAELKYKLWNTTDDDLLGTGNFGIKSAPQA